MEVPQQRGPRQERSSLPTVEGVEVGGWLTQLFLYLGLSYTENIVGIEISIIISQKVL